MALFLSTIGRTVIRKPIFRYDQPEAEAALFQFSQFVRYRLETSVSSMREHPDVDGRVRTSSAHHRHQFCMLVTTEQAEWQDE